MYISVLDKIATAHTVKLPQLTTVGVLKNPAHITEEDKTGKKITM
jgi:hypothetical protein